MLGTQKNLQARPARGMNYNIFMPRVRFFFALAPLLILLFLSACTAPSPAPSPTVPSSPLPLFTSSPSSPLRPPDPALLLRVLNYGISLERDAWNKFDYPTFHGDFLTSPEARGLFGFVQADLERYYPEGFPHAEEWFTDGRLDPNIWLPPRAVWLLAQTAVVNLLRDSQSTLTQDPPLHLFSLSPTPLFTLHPISHELDGDPTPEWLVQVTSEPYNLHGWIPLDENGSDGYTLIPNDIQHENLMRGQSTTFQFTPDLNGDGLDDLVMHFDGQALGTQFGELRVYGRVDGRVILLEALQLKAGERYDVAGEQVQITIPRSINFECHWTQTNLYQWRGEERHYTILDEAPPATPFCQAALALSPLANLPPDQRASLLESALLHLSPETTPSTDYLALLYFHLFIAYSAQGFEDKASHIYFSNLYALESVFASQVKDMEQIARGRLWSLCNELYAMAQEGAFEMGDLAPYFSPAAMFLYGEALTSFSPLVCPLQMLVEHQLQTFQMPAHLPPGKQPLELSFFLEYLAPYPVDQDMEEEWIGLLNLEIPQVLLFDQQDGFWRIDSLAQFNAPLSPQQNAFQIEVTDVNEDGVSEILMVATLGESVPVSQYPACWEAGAAQVSEFLIVSADNEDVLSKTVFCGDPPRLTELSQAQVQAFVAEKPPQLPNLKDPRPFYQFLERQETQLFQSLNYSPIREMFATLLSETTLDFAGAEGVIPRLMFAIGLSYELEGDMVAARAAYLDLIAQWPASPWAWLAEARLEP